MKLSKRNLCPAVITVALLLVCRAAVPGQVIAVRAGKLVEPETGTITTDQIILIENGRIKAVGPGLQSPAGEPFVDLSKYTVLPGLFDAHSHLCQTTSPDNRDLFTTDISEPTAYRAIIGVANAKAMLESGFT